MNQPSLQPVKKLGVALQKGVVESVQEAVAVLAVDDGEVGERRKCYVERIDAINDDSLTIVFSFQR